MNKKFIITSLIVFCICLTSCSVNTAYAPRQEVSSYEEQVIDADLPLQLELECDYGEIEVYRWDRKQVKFETTRRIRGTEPKEKLTDKLGRIQIKTDKKEKIISYMGKSGLREADYPDFCLILRIYIPKRTEGINIKLSEGSVLFLDDMKCNISVAAGHADLEIKCMEGRINYLADEGRARIMAGELDTDSVISTGKGNIDVRAAFKEGGNYVLETGSGMVRLEVSKDLNADFNYSGAEQEESAVGEGGILPARFKLKSGIGKIDVIRM
jgi:hypothetical protein